VKTRIYMSCRFNWYA